MSIKSLINNRAHLEALIDYLAKKQEVLQKSLNSASDPVQIYRLQGEIRRIEKLKLIREEVLANESSAG